ncbi:MAG: hypothetical protein KA244_04095 [Deltaproteobacteria bacterium]|nr:hypothetical protein [Deltaproteobacteria bacterium]
MLTPPIHQRPSARPSLSASIVLACAALVLQLNGAPVHAGEPAPAEAIVGSWKPADRDVTVKIEGTGNIYTGTVSASVEAAQVGKVILRGLAFNEAEHLYRGEVFAAKRGMFVPAVIRVTDAKSFRLTAGSGLFTRDVVWQRK